MDNSIVLTADELTWLSASTMIDNHYSLSGSPVFQYSDQGVSTDDEGDLAENSSLHPHLSLPVIPTTRAQIPAGMIPSTRGSGSTSSSNFEGAGSPFQIHRQPITPPPTPPRRHLYPNYIPQADHSLTAPPSPSMSTVTVSSTGRTAMQTEWIYRRPKITSPGTHAALSRHGSASASCTDSPSPTPSYSSLHHRNSKYRKHASAGSRPRPSSPVLLSSTSQLVDSVLQSPPLSSKTHTPGMPRHFANASVSSLQSSIRVSPLNNERVHHRTSPKPVSLERCPSTASTMTSASTTTAIWSALRIGKSGTSPGEHSRALKSIPSQSQIALDSPVTPTFIPPSSMSSVSLPSISRLPSTPPKDHFANGPRRGLDSPIIPPPLLQKDKDRSLAQQQAQPYSRRDKLVSSSPIPIVGLSAAGRDRDVGMGIDVFGVLPSSLTTSNNSSPTPPSRRPRPSTSPAAGSPSPSGTSNNTITMNMSLRRTSKTNSTTTRDRDRTSSFTSDCSVTTSATTHTSVTTTSSYHLDTPPSSAALPDSVQNVIRNGSGNLHGQFSNYDSTSRSPLYVHGSANGKHHRQHTSFINQGSGTGATAAARSQAYAQLTSRRRRPSASSSGTISSRVHGSGFGNLSTIVPMSTSYPPPSTPPPPPLSQTHQHTSLPTMPQRVASTSSFSHSRSRSTHTYPYMSTPSQSPQLPQELPSYSLPKAKSILTRTSSMSTKNSSACGGATKSVKFVEIPEVYYRSRHIDYDEFDLNTYRDDGSGDEEEEDGDESVVAVGAKGEGQEGAVLRDCMGIDVEAIDMDINTYLGIGVEEKEDGKDVRLSFRRMQEGFKVGSLWGKKEKVKERAKKEDESKDNITIGEKEKEKEKEKSSGLGLKRLMGLTTRKAAPPPLTLNISSPLPLASTSQKSPSINLEIKSKKDTPPSPGLKSTISGPYTLGSYLPPPPRSNTGNSPLPSPSSSTTHHSFSSRAIQGSSSNTSLNRMSSSSRRNHSHSHHTRSSRSPSIRRPNMNPNSTIANGFDHNTERPVGPNIAGTRPKGMIGFGFGSDMNVDRVLDLPSHHPIVPVGKSPSFESFRSAKSFGTAQSIRSVKSTSGNSIRNVKAWMMNRVVGLGSGSGSGSGSTNGITEID